ncbi:MAG: FHA domain-containing protein [Vicinamibacterales bacterium]
MRVRFGTFVLDPAARQLAHEGGNRHLSPKAFTLLDALVRARPRVLGKAELHALLWPDAFVADANLSNLVAEVRHALDDVAGSPRYIRTAHRVGYAFVGKASADAETDRTPCLCWLEWGRHRFPLGSGWHVIGRDAGADVRLDAATVSRRHARLVVSAAGVELEDLASKNGTFRGSTRIEQPVRLADGDAVRIGALHVTVHLARPDGSTDTHVETR